MLVTQLPIISRKEVKDMYKEMNPTRPTWEEMRLKRSFFSGLWLENQLEDPGNIECEAFITDEYKSFNDNFYITPTIFAYKLIGVFRKLIVYERYDYIKEFLIYPDRTSATYYSFQFALDYILLLNQEQLFSESDQTVIKKKFMFLLFKSIGNFLYCLDKPIDLMYTKVSSICEIECDNEILCGLILCLLNLLSKIRNDSKRELEFFHKKFLVSGYEMVRKQLQKISSDKELFHFVQRQLIYNINSIKYEIYQEKKEQQNSLIDHRRKHHLNSNLVSHCIFERLLIDSVVYTKSYKHLLIVLKYLLKNGICCCNITIDTLEVFLRSTTIPSVFLKLIKKRFDGVVFKGAKMNECNDCCQKIEMNFFREGYLDLIKKELAQRDGYELHHLYYHLIISQKVMPKEFLKELIVNIIVPVFRDAKLKFFSDQDNNQEFKEICCFCLQLMNGNADIMVEAFSEDIIYELGNCTLIPSMSIYSCMILRNGFEYFVTTVDKADLSQKIKSVLFTNTHSLISELLDIYNEIGLSKISFQVEPKPSTSDACGFEIVDEHNLLIRENLSKLDVLFLSSVHWNIICDLIAKHRSFKADFLANLCNNFNEDILFSIAYHAINTILLRRDIAIKPIIIKEKKQNNHELEVNTRCDYLTPLNVNEYDINYDLIISGSYKLFEICQNFSDKLQSESRKENPFCMTYNTARDKNVMFYITSIHRDNFLSENAIFDAQNNQKCVLDKKDHKDSDIYTYQQWFHQFFTSIGDFESKNVRDVITKFVNRFIHPEDELQEIYRLNAIKEVTNNIGTKYLSSIARSCFEICFRLWRNQKLGK